MNHRWKDIFTYILHNIVYCRSDEESTSQYNCISTGTIAHPPEIKLKLASFLLILWSTVIIVEEKYEYRCEYRIDLSYRFIKYRVVLNCVDIRGDVQWQRVQWQRVFTWGLLNGKNSDVVAKKINTHLFDNLSFVFFRFLQENIFFPFTFCLLVLKNHYAFMYVRM